MFHFKRLRKSREDKQKRELPPHDTSFDNTDTNCGNRDSGLSKKSKQGKDVPKKEMGKRLFSKKASVKNSKAATPTNSDAPSEIETKQVEALKPLDFSNKDTKTKLFHKLYAKRRHSVADIPSFVGCRIEEENKFESKTFDTLNCRHLTSKKNVKGKIFSKMRDGRRHSVALVTNSVSSKTEQENKLESKRFDTLKQSETSRKGSNQKLLGNIPNSRKQSVVTIGSRSSVAIDNEVMTRERRLLDIAQLDRYIAYLQQNPSNDGLSRLCCAQLLRTFYTQQERNYLNTHNRLQAQGQRRHSVPSRHLLPGPLETRGVAVKEGEEESGDEEGEREFCDNRRVKDNDCSSSASASTRVDDDDDDDDDDDYSDDSSYTSDYGKSPENKPQTGRRHSETRAVYPQNFEIF